MNEVSFHSGQRLALHQNRECFVPFGGHQRAEPRLLGQLRRRLRRQVNLLRARCEKSQNFRIATFLKLKWLTLHFAPVEAWWAEERVLDGGESCPPVVSSVGRSWRRGHDCGRLVGRLIGCVGGRRGRGGGAQQVSQTDGWQVATSAPFSDKIYLWR